MHEPPAGYETILTTRRSRKTREAGFVLTAVGIASQSYRRDGYWYLIVREGDVSRALGELEAYHKENRERADERSVVEPTYQGAAVGVVVYLVVIGLFATLAGRWMLGWDWLSIGQMHAASVLSGEYWRVVTALTLHLDASHLVANLIFGGVFGFLAGRLFGGGVAWLIVVLAGALGNGLNAIVQHPEHTSIGASTGVFAALGMLVAHALQSSRADRQREHTASRARPMKRWSPLIAGVVLFGLLGIGDERTDVGAHAAGFVSGMLGGAIGYRLPRRWLADHRCQGISGGLAVAIVCAAWLWGVAASS